MMHSFKITSLLKKLLGKREITPRDLVQKTDNLNWIFVRYSCEASQQTFVGLEDVFKTSWRHVFSVTILRLPRRLEDILQDVFKTSSRRLARWLQDRPQACNFIKKETLAQVFSSEFHEISKNTFFTEHLWTTASVFFWKLWH